MEPGILAAGVVQVVIWLARKLGDKLSDKVFDAAADKTIERLKAVYDLIREHVVPGSEAEAVIDKLRADPENERARTALQGYLLKLLDDEPSFAVELTRLLTEAGQVKTDGSRTFVEIHAEAPVIEGSMIINSEINQRVENIFNLTIELPRVSPQPRQLTAPTVGYMGRQKELADAIRELQSRPTGVRMLMITGQPGIGKTEFARVVADQMHRSSASGIQLEIRLSSGPASPGMGRAPKAAEDALMELLVALGVPLEEIPASLEARRARYSAELEGKHPLVLLDDAVDASQVGLLRPPRGGTVIVTSYRELPELLADGAKPIRLGPLTTGEAFRLMASRIGWRRITADPFATKKIINACDGVPLAIAITAGRIASASAEHVPLRQLAQRLEEANFRLEEMTLGQRTVIAPLTVTYEMLTPYQRRVLEIAALLRAPEFDAEVICVAGGLSVEATRDTLDQLVDLHLIEVTGRPGNRWRVHQLVAEYAYAMALRNLTPQEREEIITRAVGLYVQRARSLRELLQSPIVHLDPALAAWAQGQLELQRAALIAALRNAAVLSVRQTAHALAISIAALLDIIGEWPETVQTAEPLLDIARREKDLALEARALYLLGIHAQRRGDHQRARALLCRALDHALQTQDIRLRRDIEHALLDARNAANGRSPAAGGTGARTRTSKFDTSDLGPRPRDVGARRSTGASAGGPTGGGGPGPGGPGGPDDPGGGGGSGPGGPGGPDDPGGGGGSGPGGPGGPDDPGGGGGSGPGGPGGPDDPGGGGGSGPGGPGGPDDPGGGGGSGPAGAGPSGSGPGPWRSRRSGGRTRRSRTGYATSRSRTASAGAGGAGATLADGALTGAHSGTGGSAQNASAGAPRSHLHDVPGAVSIARGEGAGPQGPTLYGAG